MIPITHYLIVSFCLLSVGLAVVITRKNAIMALIGIELMLNAANINLVAFSRYDGVQLQGQMFALFVIIIAAAEAAVGLAIVLKVFNYFRTPDLDKVDSLSD
ncbi:NADH-quinone oxidoreductase subunit NuoK [Roseivirga sp. BDSF3-8]|uniref:NADH-quinone oxidoreductase subunit NuoK n=1 Tax=Roseivirga sp. BDSF3-8 TaxID=3241598 RepID=UPI003531A312